MASNHALDALGHASSGSVGTAISTAALYPLDLVTTRLKAQRSTPLDGEVGVHYNGITDGLRDIVQNEGGIRALYRGLGTDIGKSVIDSFLFFGFYNYLRRKQASSSSNVKRSTRALQELALGALAGACTRALTTPIGNVVARKQTSSDDGNKSLVALLKEIYHESGLLGLWSGYSATLVLTMNPSITFFVDRRLAKRIIPALEEEDVPVAYIAFLLAAFSKATATAITYPFQAAKTRLQVARTPDREAASSEKSLGSQAPPTTVSARLARIVDATIFGVLIRIIKEEGVPALYNGVRGELLKSFFSHGLTMFAKGVFHRLIVRLWLQHGAKISARLRSK
jgi:solute carrier family 25 (peroxisomal adenine nucleotide transporter), member 17